MKRHNLFLKLIRHFLVIIGFVSYSVHSYGQDNATWIYEINPDADTVTLTGSAAVPDSYLEVPKNIDGYTVTKIGDSAFKGKDIEKLRLPETILLIGSNAFADNSLEVVFFEGDRPNLSRSSSFQNNVTTNPFGNVMFFYCSTNSGWPGESIRTNQRASASVQASYVACPLGAINLDVNLDGKINALVDGLLITRLSRSWRPQEICNILVGTGIDCSELDAIQDRVDDIPLDSGFAEALMQVMFGYATTDVFCIRNPHTTCKFGDYKNSNTYHYQMVTQLERILKDVVIDLRPPANNSGEQQRLSGKLQLVDTGGPETEEMYAGQQVKLTVRSTANGDANLAGIGLRVHFNSSLLEACIVERDAPDCPPLNLNYLDITSKVLNDVLNFDNDLKTDKFVLMSEYGDMGAWGSIRFNEVDLSDSVFFTAKETFEDTKIRFSASAITEGFSFASEEIILNRDKDRDNDGVIDLNDNCIFDSNPEQINTDGDDAGNVCDDDDDNDNVQDSADIFPLDSGESSDWDSDGIGDNADSDDDNDNVSDVLDVFPRNAREWGDNDSDDIGDNSDADDDNDGVPDHLDFYPLMSLNGLLDSDGDGVPDICNDSCIAAGMAEDHDDDNDGVLDSVDFYPLDPSKANQRLLDIDGDGGVDALTDGLLLLRYSFGLSGDALTSGVVSPNATRSAQDIEDYLRSVMPNL
jgi:hypothetical protein